MYDCQRRTPWSACSPWERNLPVREMDSPTVTSDLLHIRKRPGDTSDIASSTPYIFCDGPRYNRGIGTRAPWGRTQTVFLEHARDIGQTVMNVQIGRASCRERVESWGVAAE